MAHYIAKFVDHEDHVFGRHPFEAENDQAAIELANRLLKTRLGKGHEIWQDDRLVHREIY